MKNLGWNFYRTYFDLRSLQESIKTAQDENKKLVEGRKSEKNIELEVTEKFFKTRNSSLFNEKFTPNDLLRIAKNDQVVKLTTSYPGLLSGSGVSHETGRLGELKLGFSFDHTTGLPYLPGSTIKGNLRHLFPFRLRLQASRINSEKEKSVMLQKANDLELYCIELFKETLKVDITSKQLLQFEWTVFEGNTIGNIEEIFAEQSILWHELKTNKIATYETDVFYDACIDDVKVSKLYPDKYFLGNDFITPHKNPLKNPIPIQFLKILPNVTWAFQFDLKNYTAPNIEISASQKLALFKQILKDQGIGAKTNVGYGRLS